jgi:uncharacterized protein YecA (UPF0149 family)
LGLTADKQPKIRIHMAGKRQRRIDRFIESQMDMFNSSEQFNIQKVQPILNPPLFGQLRRGIRPKRNNDCPCGSGKKFKHCHKEYEAETQRLTY